MRFFEVRCGLERALALVAVFTTLAVGLPQAAAAPPAQPGVAGADDGPPLAVFETDFVWGRIARTDRDAVWIVPPNGLYDLDPRSAEFKRGLERTRTEDPAGWAAREELHKRWRLEGGIRVPYAAGTLHENGADLGALRPGRWIFAELARTAGAADAPMTTFEVFDTLEALMATAIARIHHLRELKQDNLYFVKHQLTVQREVAPPPTGPRDDVRAPSTNPAPPPSK